MVRLREGVTMETVSGCLQHSFGVSADTLFSTWESTRKDDPSMMTDGADTAIEPSTTFVLRRKP